MDYEDLKERLEELKIDMALYEIKILFRVKFLVFLCDIYFFSPRKCEKGKIRTKDLGKGKKAVVCYRTDTKKWEAQAILIPRK